MFDELPTVPTVDDSLPGTLDLGAFSVSLTVADLSKSQAFYEALGFVVTGGDPDHDYLILKNGETTIGLFHGMFERNILTFNPGLTDRMERVESFTDVREIEAHFRSHGVEIDTPVSEEAGDSGPATVIVTDPDGNPVMIDQFF